MSENFAEIFKNEANDLKPGNIVKGKVVDIGNEFVIVNAGLKSESMIPIQQFQDGQGELEVSEGDLVEVAVDALEDGYGMTRLSREKAKRAKVWEVLEKAHEESATVFGVITSKVKGGFIVDLKGISAFLPGSLVDVRPVRDTTYLEGKELEFKIIKLDYMRNNAIVSRRAVIEAEHSVERDELIKRLEKDAIVKGIVKNLTDYGAFLDLGGIDGLLHITDMSWRRVKHPSEVVTVGDEIEVKVIEYDRERMRVSLGLKQLDGDPWAETDIKKEYPPGTCIDDGIVTKVIEYGCFVEIKEGLEGLVHISELDWRNKNIQPSKIVSEKQKVKVMVLDVDNDRRRISLGIKQCTENPWAQFSERYQIGDQIKGVVKLVTEFGLFVGLAEFNIDGLVHISDISWTKPGEEAIRNYSKGDDVKAEVLSINIERERISLGIKQLEGNPIADYLNKHPKQSVVKGTIEKLEDSECRVMLDKGVVAMLPYSNLPQESAKENLKEGDEVEATLISIDKRSGLITLSVKAKEESEKEQAIKDYTASGDTVTASIEEKVKDQTES